MYPPCPTIDDVQILIGAILTFGGFIMLGVAAYNDDTGSRLLSIVFAIAAMVGGIKMLMDADK